MIHKLQIRITIDFANLDSEDLFNHFNNIEYVYEWYWAMKEAAQGT